MRKTRQVGFSNTWICTQVACPKARLQDRRSGSSRARGGERTFGWTKFVSHARSDGERTSAQALRPNDGETGRKLNGRVPVSVILIPQSREKALTVEALITLITENVLRGFVIFLAPLGMT